MRQRYGPVTVERFARIALPGDANFERWTVDGGRWSVRNACIAVQCRPPSAVHRPLEFLPPLLHEPGISSQVRNLRGDRRLVRLKQAGKAEQRRVNVAGRHGRAATGKLFDAGKIGEQFQERRLALKDDAPPASRY